MQQTQTQGQAGWGAYDPAGYYCEMLGQGRGSEAELAAIRDRLGRISMAELQRRADLAERELFNLGITFTVYSERDAIDRILPFDVIPRVLTAADWRTIESGVRQRVQAIHPAFTSAGYAHDIQLQALTEERAEPHLAGLRSAGLLEA